MGRWPRSWTVRKHKRRLKQVAAELAGLRPGPRLAPEVVENRLAEWRLLLRQSATQGRAVLQRVLRGGPTFAPLSDGSGCEFAGDTRCDKLFAGVVAPPPPYIQAGDLRGTEHFLPEDTLEGDYGRLLEQAEKLR